jgi:protein-tyrosine phosphatase
MYARARALFVFVVAVAPLAGCIDRSGSGYPMCRDPLLGDLGDGGVDGDDGGDAGGADGGALDAGGEEAGAMDVGAVDAGTATCRRSQPVFVCEVPNARDLGGTPVASGQAMACGAIYRGPPLAGLSADGCEVFARLGIRTVIDLRVESERAAVPEAACVVAGANVISAPMPIPYTVTGAEYIADLDAKTSIAAAFAALGDPAAYPVYIHCTWGRDRTGVLVAAILSALGATRADVVQEYLLSQRTVGAFPSSLIAMLDEIDARGGIAAVLAAAGVTPDQLANLRARAVD